MNEDENLATVIFLFIPLLFSFSSGGKKLALEFSSYEKSLKSLGETFIFCGFVLHNKKLGRQVLCF